MIIRRCRINLPDLFEDQVIEFGHAITLIKGGNGSGKSLLATSIIDSIWGTFKGERLIHEPAASDLSIDTVIETEKGSLLSIQRRDPGNCTLSTISQDEEHIIYAGPLKPADMPLEEYLPQDRDIRDLIEVPDMDQIRTLMHIEASEPAGIGPSPDISAIRKLLVTDETGFNRITDDVSEYRNRQSAGKGIMTRILSLEGERKDIRKQIEFINIRNSRQQRLTRDREEIRHKIEEYNQEIGRLQEESSLLDQMHKNLERVEEISARLEETREKLEEERNLHQSAIQMEKEIGQLFPDFNESHRLDNEYLDQIQERFFHMRNIHQEHDAIRHTVQARKTVIKKLMGFILTGGILFSLLLGIYQPRMVPFFLPVAAAAVFGVSLILGVALLLVNRKDELASLDERFREAEKDLLSFIKGKNMERSDDQITEIYEILMKYFQDVIDYRERHHELLGIRQELKDSGYMESIEKEIGSLMEEEKSLSKAIKGYRKQLIYSDLDELSLTSLNELSMEIDHRINVFYEMIDEQTKIQSRIDQELENLTDEDAILKELEERDASLEKELEELKQIGESLQFLSTVLEEARTSWQKKRMDSLVETAREYYTFLEGGQSRDKIKKSTIRDFIDGKLGREDLGSRISQTLNISFRMALPHFLIDGREPLPLIIDEPYQFMDNERARRFGSLCQDLSEQRQIIILTCRHEEVDRSVIVDID